MKERYMNTIYVNGILHSEYFVQRISVINQNNKTRFEFFTDYLRNKKVLHIGFVDYPITNPENNLHLNLSKICNRLDGYDLNVEGTAQLTIENGTNYFNWDDVPNDYDFVIAPEVIEHVGNVESFLKQISQKNGTLIITAPDSVILNNRYQVVDEIGNAFEVVHPDHNCVYTPYTLKNVIDKYAHKKVQSLHWVENHSIVAICE